ncbi:hypothetical protein KZZ52_04860 [Dactylosporangium sp. AC04546]|uniref:hypothetical protein n=1 Tax=Dactylosporangium sp. AC04546 TaxID=2862460 RepID=UPI001EDECE4B|nr:hypothetical protein [Dactylosporangium sp. AC04546]WVK84746.1 hypothetical protein KZZ52_04860 [Dactylosporangium sp. AC04546]
MKHRRATHRPRLAVLAAVIGLAASGAIASPAAHGPERPDVPAAQQLDAGAGLGAAPQPSKAQAKAPATERRCGLDAKLVPDCGLLWGVAPGAFTDLPASRTRTCSPGPAATARRWCTSTPRTPRRATPAPDSSEPALREFRKLAESTTFSVTL